MMKPSGRQIYNIPAHMPFSDVLARVLLGRYRHQPLALSEVQIFLPTRRAVRNLSQSFLRQSKGKALMLPRFHTLGDLDEEELTAFDVSDAGEGEARALARLQQDRLPWNDGHRLLFLMKMLSAAKYGLEAGQSLSHDQQLAMASSLLRLLDQTETESLDIATISQVVNSEALEDHWKNSLRFLESLSEVWPMLEEQFGKISAARFRRLKAEAQVELWKIKPPQGPIIAAGTTASIPATRQLLRAIARLPNSEILLPGLDALSAQSAQTWAMICADPTHPQYGLAQLCQSLELSPHAVPIWPATAQEVENKALDARVALAQWASLPPEATQPIDAQTMGHRGWRELPPGPRAGSQQEILQRFKDALNEIELVEATDQNEEAKIIALVLRHTLDLPEQTAALVTPNRDLARMVTAQMARWGVALDDSAGTPLDKSPVALLLRGVLDVVCDHAVPSSLLDVLKNPLVQAQDWLSPKVVSALEQHALRGPQPGQGLSGVQSALAQQLVRLGAQSGSQSAAALQEAMSLVARLESFLRPLLDLSSEVGLGVVTKTLCGVLEEMVPPHSLWRGEEGRSLASLLASISEDEATASQINISDLRLYRNFLSGLINQTTVRLPFGAHPRISVLGTLEARLLNVDHVILGGLNENSFPMNSEPGPWLSRRMRAQFGLPPLERKVGLAAHDFIQSMGNRRVTMTRSLKEAGAQTTASRFLRRLESYLRQLELSYGLDLLHRLRQPINPALPWRAWAQVLDQPIIQDAGKLGTRFADPQPSLRPKPVPAVHRRPTVLWAKDIETWRANPYAFYAHRILHLRPWEAVEASADARIRGTLIHAAAESYVKAKQAAQKGEKGFALGTAETDFSFFMGTVRRAANEQQISPTLQSLWWSRIENAARWFLKTDSYRRMNGLDQCVVEAEGSMNLSVGEPQSKRLITVKARADRIDLNQNGSVAIIDYKTGQPPYPKEVFQGRKPQLVVEALIARQGRIEGVPRQNSERPAPLSLEYWQLSGGKDPGGIKQIIPDKVLEMSMDEALTELQGSFEYMLSEGLTKLTPMVATAAGWGNYHHLSRLQEWSSLETSIQDTLARRSSNAMTGGGSE